MAEPRRNTLRQESPADNGETTHPSEIESPYIKGTNTRFAWDSTSLEWLKRCPRLLQYQQEGWMPREESIHLRFGQEVHQALHDYDTCRIVDKCDHEEAVIHTVKEA